MFAEVDFVSSLHGSFECEVFIVARSNARQRSHGDGTALRTLRLKIKCYTQEVN